MSTEAQHLPEALVPAEIIEAYTAVPPARISRLGGGMVNVTYLLEADPRSSANPLVVQRLHKQFNPGVVRDADAVAKHLTAKGWVVPTIARTHDGQLTANDNKGGLWRATNFINEAQPLAGITPLTLRSAGAVLGRFHADLADLDYQPEFRIPNFHDIDHHAWHMQERLQWRRMPEWARQAGNEAMGEYAMLNRDEGALNVVQLVHGDPRVDNMFFRPDGDAFSIGDFDTLMVAPMGDDIGDLLRSLVESDLESGSEAPTDLRLVTDAYREAKQLEVDPDDFFADSFTAAKRITLDLTMRFVSDNIDNYFQHDPTRYASHEDFLIDRVNLQRAVFDRLENLSPRGTSS